MRNDENKYRHLAKDTGIFAIGNFGTKLLSFFLMSLYTSYLTTSEYGVADVLITTISLLLPVMTLSMAEATLRFLFDKNVERNDILNIDLSIVTLGCIVTFAGSGLVVLFAPTLRQYFWYFVIIFTLTSFETSFSYVAKGIGRTKTFAIKGILYTFVFSISNIILMAVFKLGLNGYFLSFIIAYFITCVYLFFSAHIFKIKIKIKLNRSLLKQMLKYSIPFIPAAISWWINSSSDKYMLLWITGSSSNGLYGAAQKIPTLLTAVTTIFTQAWQLSAMKNYKDDDFSDFFSHIFKLISAVLLLCACGILVFNKLLASVFFKNEFYEAWKYVPMLVIASVFSTFAGFLASVFTSAKKTNILFISTCIGAVVNIILNYVLISLIGILGATIATAISFCVMVIIRLITMKKLVTVKAQFGKIVISMLLLFVASILVVYIEKYYIIALATATVVILMNISEMIETFKYTLKKLLSK